MNNKTKRPRKKTLTIKKREEKLQSRSSNNRSNPAIHLVGPPGINEPLLIAAASSSTNTKSFVYSSSDSDEDAYPPNYKEKKRTSKTNLNEPIRKNTSHGPHESFGFSSSGNPCLDFFFHVVPDTPEGTLTTRLADAWNSDPLTALKLLCNLRGIRGTGKANREGFYVAALWLHKHHPKTLALNLPSFAQFGYLKDLLEILSRVLNAFYFFTDEGAEISKPRDSDYKEVKNATCKRKRNENATRALSCYASNESYRFLHDQIAGFFSELLSSDLEHLNYGNVKKIGLAAKWCPSLDSSFDRTTLICESIARKMFPRDSLPEYQNLSEEHYSYQVRNRLRKEVLTPLRKALLLPELLMSSGQWDSIPYNQVTSLAMMRYKEAFLKHDSERASEFITKVENGESSVKASVLQPHEILKQALDEKEDELAELQWKQLVQNLANQKKFKNCISACYKSSHGGKMEVWASLSLLISELTEEPWKGKVITFGEEQKIHKIEGESMKEKVRFAKNANSHVHAHSNIRAVFDEILHMSRERTLEPAKMVKTVFVFSNMDFANKINSPSSSSYDNEMETDYEAICRNFEENGYGSVVPKIVFWNMSESKCTPVLAKQKGVALVSGYSKNLLKLFLEMDGEITPETVMNAVIRGDEYQKLIVFD